MKKTLNFKFIWLQCPKNVKFFNVGFKLTILAIKMSLLHMLALI